MKQRELIVKFIIDMENFNHGTKHAEETLGGLAHKMTGSKDGKGKAGIFGNLGQTFSNMLTSRMGANPIGGLMSGITRSLGAAMPVIAGITVAAGLMWGAFSAGTQAETTLTSLSVMTGSMQEAKRIYKEVVDFTAKTPLMSEQTTPAAKQLLAVKYSADQLIPTMKMIGDVAAGSGKNFNELISIMAKNKSSGIIQGEDLNQMIDAGIPILDEFSKMFGKTGIEIRKMASQGKVSYQDLEKAFMNMTSKGGIYDNMMDKQSRTVSGLLSTIKDNTALIFTYMSGVLEPEGGTTMWTYLRDIIGGIGDKLSAFVENTRGFWTDLGTAFGGIFKLIFDIGNVVMTMLTPTFYYIGAIIWGITKALNVVLFIADKIFGVFFRLGGALIGWVDRTFKVTEALTLFKNQWAATWVVIGTYVDIQLQKLENWFAKGGKLKRFFGEMLGFDFKDEQGKAIEPSQTIEQPKQIGRKFTEEEQQKIRERQRERDKINLAPEIFQKKYENNNSRNITNNHQITIVNTDKEGANRYVTNKTGKPLEAF